MEEINDDERLKDYTSLFERSEKQSYMTIVGIKMCYLIADRIKNNDQTKSSLKKLLKTTTDLKESIEKFIEKIK